MPRSYDGPYPSKDFASRLLADHGHEMTAARWLPDETSLRKDSPPPYGLPHAASMFHPGPETTVTATVLDNRCLLARVHPTDDRPTSFLYVIDLPTSAVVARYYERK